MKPIEAEPNIVQGRVEKRGDKQIVYTEDTVYVLTDIRKKSFGECVLYYRHLYGLTMRSLNQASGINLSVLADIESGKTTYPRQQNLTKLVQGFGWNEENKNAKFLRAKAEESRQNAKNAKNNS
jgi:hypothetical protein